MSSFDIVIARSRFNFETQIDRFLIQKNVILQSFEVYGGYKSPRKFKVLIKNNGDIKEQLIELNFNEENNNYFPHYLGLVINSGVEGISIIGLTNIEEENKDSISYSISFADNESDNEDGDGDFPLYKIINPKKKSQSKSLTY